MSKKLSLSFVNNTTDHCRKDPGDYPEDGCCDGLVCERRLDRYGRPMDWMCYEGAAEVVEL
jgi:hypothetical protein